MNMATKKKAIKARTTVVAPTVPSDVAKSVTTVKTNQIYAGFVVRLAATFIDALVVMLINIGVAITVILTMFSWATWWVYSVVMLAQMDGATIGKKLFGIKVVASTPKIGYGTALLREVVGKFLSSLIFGLGYLWVIWDSEKQGWHDKVASTHVVHVTPFGGGRKILAWIISIAMIITLCTVPFLLGFGILTLGSYLGRNAGDINQSIQQLKELEKSNNDLQSSLEELKDLQKQLEASQDGVVVQ